jgi:hypothetical protein
MTSFLPHAVRDAIAARGDFGASETFGVVTLVVLLVLLVEHEVVRTASGSRVWIKPVFVASASLALAVWLTIAVRIADLLP